MKKAGSMHSPLTEVGDNFLKIFLRKQLIIGDEA